MKKLPFHFWVTASGIILMTVFYWLVEIRVSQLSPHRMVSTYDGKVFREWWTTNPEYQVFYVGTNYTATGAVYSVECRTNYYWRVWKIFR